MEQVITLPKSLEEYKSLINSLMRMGKDEQRMVMAEWGKRDLYFLLRYVMGRTDAEHPFIFDRCRQFQASPYGHLDLWARGHYKSTVITHAHSIFEIINDPNITIGLFSNTKPIAKGLLRTIKQEFEQNDFMKFLYSDILYQSPEKESPKWSEDIGLQVKRDCRKKECTIEAWGVVEGQPISKHFDLLLYDDVVTDDNSKNGEQIQKTTDALKLSFNLGSTTSKMIFVGTRYSAGDSYETLMSEGTVSPRIFPATKDGMVDGEPVFLTKEKLAEKRRQMGPYIFSCQMLQNPVAENAQGFREEWLNYYEKVNKKDMNIYILVDPASSKKKYSDYTVMSVIGLGHDKNYYLLDMVRDKLNLTERVEALFKLRQKWQPRAVGYEKYSMQADIEYIKQVQEDNGIRFKIVPLGGNVAKIERIKRLVPKFEEGLFYIPKLIMYLTNEGKKVNLIENFKYEYTNFPRTAHDDILDSIARILEPDLKAKFPNRNIDISSKMKAGSNYIFGF